MLALIRDLSPAQWLADPGDGSRSIYRIVEHMAESGCVYLRYLVGKVDGLAEALRAVQGDPAILPESCHRCGSSPARGWRR